MLNIIQNLGKLVCVNCNAYDETGIPIALCKQEGTASRTIQVKDRITSGQGRQHENSCSHLKLTGTVHDNNCLIESVTAPSRRDYPYTGLIRTNVTDEVWNGIAQNVPWQSSSGFTAYCSRALVLFEGESIAYEFTNVPTHVRVGRVWIERFYARSRYTFNGYDKWGYALLDMEKVCAGWDSVGNYYTIAAYSGTVKVSDLSRQCQPVRDHYPPALLREMLPDVVVERVTHRLSRFPVYPEAGLVTALMKDLQSLNINTVTAVQGFLNFFRDIKALIDAAEGEVSVKWLNNVYLQMKYGTANTFRDAAEVTAFLRDELRRMAYSYGNWQKTHAADGLVHPQGLTGLTYDKSYEVTHATVTAGVMDDALAKLAKASLDTDVFPELGNIWDVIPFSFVVDWFLPVGEILDAMDANTYRSTLRVKSFTWSYKHILTGVPFGELIRGFDNLTARIDVCLYRRFSSKAIPYPEPQLQLPQEFTQWLPAGALIAQGVLK